MDYECIFKLTKPLSKHNGVLSRSRYSKGPKVKKNEMSHRTNRDTLQMVSLVYGDYDYSLDYILK